MRSVMRDAAAVPWEQKKDLPKMPSAYTAAQWGATTFGGGRGHTMRFDPMRGMRRRRYTEGSYCYHLGLYEPKVSELIRTHLWPGAVFWAVGADAGCHTLMAARVVGAEGAVVAFEPNPEAAAIIRDQLPLNRFDNVEVEDVAVGAREGTVILRQAPNMMMSGLDGVVAQGAPRQVRCTTLDAMLGFHRWPDVIKMDIEGAESLALPAARELLSSPRRPLLLLSVHGAHAAGVCHEVLTARGYDTLEMDGFAQMLICTPVPQ